MQLLAIFRLLWTALLPLVFRFALFVGRSRPCNFPLSASPAVPCRSCPLSLTLTLSLSLTLSTPHCNPLMTKRKRASAEPSTATPLIGTRLVLPKIMRTPHIATSATELDDSIEQAVAALVSAVDSSSPQDNGETGKKLAGRARGRPPVPRPQSCPLDVVVVSAAPATPGKGLRHFSAKVAAKVEEKGSTTYNEV